MKQQMEFQKTKAELFSFTEGEVSEYHVIIHATTPTDSFKQQLEAVLDTYQQLTCRHLEGAITVFKRYFLSDAANQADEVIACDVNDCAKSIIQQPPLDGTKIGLWAYLATKVKATLQPCGLYQVSHNGYRHLWNGSSHNLASNSEYQTRLLFNEYIMQLAQEGCTLADNCLRTWLFVNDIDLNYSGVVRARNQVFFTQGLTPDTHFIASTGIGGSQQEAQVLTQMDNYAIAGIKKEQVHYLYASTHLNRTSEYGVSFERGAYVDYGDRRHVIVSGTASIDNKGRVVYPKDVAKQTLRMWDNVEALLKEADCTFEHMAHMIVYLRDPSDYTVVSKMFQQRFPTTPCIIVHAAVCRQQWLVEMECMAIRDMRNAAFNNF